MRAWLELEIHTRKTHTRPRWALGGGRKRQLAPSLSPFCLSRFPARLWNDGSSGQNLWLKCTPDSP